MWHLSNDAEKSALHHRNKLHFNTYSNRKMFFQIEIPLLYFWSNKYSLSETENTNIIVIILNNIIV